MSVVVVFSSGNCKTVGFFRFLFFAVCLFLGFFSLSVPFHRTRDASSLDVQFNDELFTKSYWQKPISHEAEKSHTPNAAL